MPSLGVIAYSLTGSGKRLGPEQGFGLYRLGASGLGQAETPRKAAVLPTSILALTAAKLLAAYVATTSVPEQPASVTVSAIPKAAILEAACQVFRAFITLLLVR